MSFKRLGYIIFHQNTLPAQRIRMSTGEQCNLLSEEIVMTLLFISLEICIYVYVSLNKDYFKRPSTITVMIMASLQFGGSCLGPVFCMRAKIVCF